MDVFLLVLVITAGVLGGIIVHFGSQELAVRQPAWAGVLGVSTLAIVLSCFQPKNVMNGDRANYENVVLFVLSYICLAAAYSSHFGEWPFVRALSSRALEVAVGLPSLFIIFGTTHASPPWWTTIGVIALFSYPLLHILTPIFHRPGDALGANAKPAEPERV